MQKDCLLNQELSLLLQSINGDDSFAFFRLPNEETGVFIKQSSSALQTFVNFPENENLEGYFIAPFHTTQDTPFILIQPQEYQTFNCSLPFPTPPNILKSSDNSNHKNRDTYAQAFNHCLSALKSNELKKVVLSRIQDIAIEELTLIHKISLFIKACQLYPTAYISLWYTPFTGTWLVATPELFLSLNHQQGKTIALAGTLLQGNGHWQEKEIEEHTLVSTYIESILKPFTTAINKDKLQAIKAGNLMHLQTAFQFYLSPTTNPLSLIKALHPTPATCGLPTEKAKPFILQIENHQRRYYSGYSGWISKDKINLYVSLRCLEQTENSIRLYAGGGLLKNSSLEKEWQETENKLQTILKLF